MKTINAPTVEKYLLSQGKSHNAVANAISALGECNSDKERQAFFIDLQARCGGTKAASQNKSVQGSTKSVRARKGDGTYQGDDLSTPDKNEAYTTAKKTYKKSAKKTK
tara:strand:+ start:14936 stop:15259 length:324 start_codon:yes stop_codon:yes gene_type:complete